MGQDGQAKSSRSPRAPMPKMIFVNLPVADVEKSVAFYEAIGFIKDERFSQPGSAGAMEWSETIVFMILSHAHFADFTSKRIVDAKSEVEALLCLSLDSRQGVDAIVEKAVLAGGKADPGPKQDDLLPPLPPSTNNYRFPFTQSPLLAVITGGTTGIGFAAAKLFVEEGAYVFITGRRQKELDEAVKAIGHNVTGVQGDVSKLADLEGRRIDVVFANAGLGEFAALGSITEEHFDRLFNINVKGALFTVQKALPLLNGGGSIILTGSVASAKGTPGFWVYGATKAAIRNFVRAWTIELKDRRIRSNVLSPGPTETALVDHQPPEAIARIVATIPMGRMGSPEEIAKAALFLASDDSSFVTGIELFVDGGRAQI